MQLCAMSPCRWPQIGWFRCQTAHILQKSNAGFQLGEAATCRWELSTMFWMSRQSRTDRKPPRWTVRAQTVNFLKLNVFHFHPKDPDYIYYIYIDRSILLRSYFIWVLSTSAKRARTRTWTTRRLQHSQPVFPAVSLKWTRNLLKSQKQLFQPAPGFDHVIIYITDDKVCRPHVDHNWKHQRWNLFGKPWF